MDSEEVKRLLASYRAQDAADPMFADALREAARDPELAAWFAEARQFDAWMGEKLLAASVPAEVKSRVLSGAPIAKATHRTHLRWAIPLAAAAVLTAALLLWQSFTPARPSRALAMQAISFTGGMPALQFVCFDASAVAGWVNKQPGAQRAGLQLNDPGQALFMKMIGSSIVDWDGQPVVMICLQNDRQMAMLYILDDSTARLPEGTSETMEKDGWATRTMRAGGQVRILTTKGRAEDLDFPMPF